VAGRIQQSGRLAMLVPRELGSAITAASVPLPPVKPGPSLATYAFRSVVPPPAKPQVAVRTLRTGALRSTAPSAKPEPSRAADHTLRPAGPQAKACAIAGRRPRTPLGSGGASGEARAIAPPCATASGEDRAVAGRQPCAPPRRAAVGKGRAVAGLCPPSSTRVHHPVRGRAAHEGTACSTRVQRVEAAPTKDRTDAQPRLY
jgi:hypothetical protein